VIVFAGKQGARLEFTDVSVSGGEFAAEVLKKIFALPGVGFGMGKFDIGFNVAGKRIEL
jgi:hypothetical protein